MSTGFDHFVVLAEMRTGSNFLESNLNAIRGVRCHGEAFNPHFIGHPDRSEILGITLAQREADPRALIDAIRADGASRGGIGGFRYFHDHDPRVLDQFLDDPRCAKIVLTRNPLESYVSQKIARATGQWKLTDVNRRKAARARFDPAEFETHLQELQAFQLRVLNRLQSSGQTAFWLDNADLSSLDVLNGLAKWLGAPGRLEVLDNAIKRQNPEPLVEKVENPEAMIAALGELDRFNLSRTPVFEPRRGPAVPAWVTAARAPLLFLPIRGGPGDRVHRWLAAIDGVDPSALSTGRSQTDMRKWMQAHRGFRSFTVVRHPVARAHAIFCRRVLPSSGADAMPQVRASLRRVHKLPIPEHMPDPGYDRAAHRAAFQAFLKFVKANLSGQTGLGPDARWSSQVAALQGFAEFVLPDAILREEELPDALPRLARQVGAEIVSVGPPEPDLPFALSEIYCSETERLTRAAYPRDYAMLGFGPWSG